MTTGPGTGRVSTSETVRGLGKCSAYAAKSGRPCPRAAEPFTINETCYVHHRAVRRWAMKRGWRKDTRTRFGVWGTATPFGVVDTWGSPTETWSS